MITRNIIIIAFFIIITALIGYYWKKGEELSIEGFESGVVREHYSDIYDGFYSNIYDQLFNSNLKNEYEIHTLKKYYLDNQPDKSSIKILDAGCGTGNHIKILDRENYQCVGVDKSLKMLEIAQKNNPGVRLVNANFLNKSVFKPREFSHIFCLFYTIYYVDNPLKAFKNFNLWLKPKGYLCIHLVQPDKFDPILEKSSSLIPLFNPQKHSHQRKTHTSLHFNNFKYEADWQFNKEDVHFVEKFLFKNTNESRKNIHKFKMLPTKKYIKIGKKCGFKLVKRIDLTPANHEYNSIYVFQKIYGM